MVQLGFSPFAPLKDASFSKDTVSQEQNYLEYSDASVFEVLSTLCDDIYGTP